MNKTEHLETYRLTVTTRAPLFIGSGKSCAKTDYVLSTDGTEVLFLDQQKLFRVLAERDLADRYESFILSGGTDMRRFLTETCRLPWSEAERLAQYRVRSKDALDQRHSLKNIQLFCRDGLGRPYVPGSSIKGALRTAFLFDKIDSDNRKDPKPNMLTDKRSAVNEAKYVNTLHYVNDRKDKTRGDMVSSIFRGIQISDSMPIDQKNMMLSDKIDVLPDRTENKLNVCRECVCPNSEIVFVLTLDRSVVGNAVTPQSLLNSLKNFIEYYADNYLYAWYDDVPSKDRTHYILLGGGAGFFSKTLIYPLYGEDAVALVQDFMANAFKRHGHGRDQERYGISPHTMKYARYKDQLYPMGLCEVSIE